jgi:site-specific recombinase XerD
MRAKKRLGHLLLKSFRPVQAKKKKKPRSLSHPPQILRLSLLRTPVQVANEVVPEVHPEELQETSVIQLVETPVEPSVDIWMESLSTQVPQSEFPLVLVSPPIQQTLPQVVLSEVVPEVVPEVIPAVITKPSVPAQLEMASLLSTEDLVRPQGTLKTSIEAFLLDQRSPHTRRAYGKDLKRFVQFLLLRNFRQGVENLNRTTLIAYKEFLISEKLEHTTIDRHLATLRSFFKWLVDDGVITKSPAEGVRFLNPKRISRTNGFSDQEVKAILSLPNLHTKTGSLHYAILMMLFYCGLRRSELCSLRTAQLAVEREQHLVRLRGKGNAERVIVMVIPVWNAIQHYFYISRRKMDRDEPLFIPLRNNRTGVLDKPLDPSMIFYIVKKYAKLSGITHRVSPHSCRATAISNARDHHVPDRAIQEFAGWASPDMITRYDKRKTSILDSAAHSIVYGAENRAIPVTSFQRDEAEEEPQEVLPSSRGLSHPDGISK